MRRLAWLAPVLVLGLSACGSMSDSDRFSLTTPGTDDLRVREVGPEPEPPKRGKPTRAEVGVIRAWANALRAGRVNQAARFFAVPTTVLDGTNPQRTLPDLDAIRAFNRGLPCGAKLVGTTRGEGSYVVATFRLTERRGPRPGPCGAGVGHLADTAFLIKKRHIVSWLRQPDPVQPDNDTS
jgi:hypothetical protein